MTLIGCKLGLRYSEVGDLSFQTFNPNASSIRNESLVDCRAFDIEGKTEHDTGCVTLVMWNNDEVPCFCPVRHLLAWVRMLGITYGYFFSSKKRLEELLVKKSSSSIVDSERIDIKTFGSAFVKRMKDLLCSGKVLNAN
jgi:hypothetical protein